MLHASLSAGEVAECKRYFDLLVREGGPCRREDLYAVLQPGMLQALARAGVITVRESNEALLAPENTPKWFFLKAAYEAGKGDQFGSKHGAVLVKGGKYLSHGHNHRFGLPGDAHIRVMHSEVHALVKLGDLQEALGGEFWIVELDGEGVGYEEAVACIMCTKAATRVGIVAQNFSSHTGVRRQNIGHKPVVCESLDMALKRVYPEGTVNPDPTEVLGFIFSLEEGAPSHDPGRGRESGRGALLAPVELPLALTAAVAAAGSVTERS